jgi:hypothetical protein
MLTKIQVMMTASDNRTGRMIGRAAEEVLQAWCCRGSNSIPVNIPILACEGFVQSEVPKDLKQPEEAPQTVLQPAQA